MSLPLELKTFLVDCLVLSHPLPRLSAREMRGAIPRELQGSLMVIPREGYIPGVAGTSHPTQL